MSSIATIRAVVREEIAAYAREHGGETNKYWVCRAAALRLRTLNLSLEELTQRVAEGVYDLENRKRTRSPAGGTTLREREVVHASTGERIDKRYEQLTIFELGQVAARKIEGGRAEILEGRRDRAVYEYAMAVAIERGLDVETTRVSDVLSDARIAEIRSGVA